MQDFVVVHEETPLFSLSGKDSQQTLLLTGLSAGLAAFVSNFTTNQPDIIRGKRTVTLLHSPEPGFRLVMKVGHSDETQGLPADAHLTRFLHQSYNWFYLLRGSFQGILNQKETQGLAEELEAFYSQYLHSYDRNLTLLNSIPAIAYMPLDRVSFTSVLSSCHDIQTAFPPIQKYMVFWKHFLVASSWNDSQDSFTLYDYLTHPDTGKCDDGLINQVKEKAQPVIKTKSLSWKKRSKSKTSGEQQQAFTGFLAPDIQLNRGVKEKIVNLNDGGKHSMIIYQLNDDWTFVFPVITETQNDSQSILSSTDFYKELEGMIQSSFTQDLSLKMEESLELGQKLMDTATVDPPIRFFYYNGKSFAYKTSIESCKALSLTGSMAVALESLVQEMVDDPLLDTVYRQASNDTWFLGKRTQERLLFMILPKSEKSLPQVQEQLKVLCDKQFPDVFY